MDEIKWEELPKVPGVKHAKVAQQLRERPGRWAVVGVYANAGAASSVAYQIRHGVLSAYQPKGAFEASSRVVDGEARIYARYVGDAS